MVVRALNKPRKRHLKSPRRETPANYGTLHVDIERVGWWYKAITQLAVFGGWKCMGERSEWQRAGLWDHTIPCLDQEPAKEGGLAALPQAVIKEAFPFCLGQV